MDETDLARDEPQRPAVLNTPLRLRVALQGGGIYLEFERPSDWQEALRFTEQIGLDLLGDENTLPYPYDLDVLHKITLFCFQACQLKMAKLIEWQQIETYLYVWTCIQQPYESSKCL